MTHGRLARARSGHTSLFRAAGALAGILAIGSVPWLPAERGLLQAAEPPSTLQEPSGAPTVGDDADPALRAASDPVVEALRRDLDRILAGAGWRSTEWGVLAVSMDSGETLFARSPRTPRAPASNVKLLTTAAALHHLGPDFRWETYALATGDVVDGTLRGDLVLYGTGDPGLSDRFGGETDGAFRSLAAGLLDAGIERIEGDVVGDGSFFQGPLLGGAWDATDLNEWFAAPVGALSFNENVVQLRIEAGAWDGAPPQIHSTPRDAGLPLQNVAVTGPGRLTIQRRHPREPIRIAGALPRGAPDVWRRITIRDPGRAAAQALLLALREAGITVDGGVRSESAADRSAVTPGRVWAPAAGAAGPRVLARHRSPPLRDYVAVINKESHNLFAEATLKTLGRIVGGDGSFQGGSEVVERFAAERLATGGPNPRIVDGSGLSPTNRVDPATFVALLQTMAEDDLWEPFRASLPEAGNRRELGRMYRTAAASNLRAKTGTIQGVSALSGVVRSAAGERIAFSIIGNHLPSEWRAKRVEDRIGVRLATFDRPVAPRVEQPVEVTASPAEDPAADGSPPAADAPPPGGRRR